MKENPIQKLTNEELISERKKYLALGLIPATVFCLLELYLIWYMPDSDLEWSVLLGLLGSFVFVFKAGRYSKEFHRRKKEEKL